MWEKEMTTYLRHYSHICLDRLTKTQKHFNENNWLLCQASERISRCVIAAGPGSDGFSNSPLNLHDAHSVVHIKKTRTWELACKWTKEDNTTILSYEYKQHPNVDLSQA
jgi:hypothetical protein